MTHNNKAKAFDIEDPELPDWIEEEALGSGDFPYDKKMRNRVYRPHLHALQVELVKLQTHLQTRGERVVIVFEGRDAAGKGGAIKSYTQFLNPRYNRITALPKPNDRQSTEWYFQRYITHMPAGGETVLFDRSWYNRGVVEPVMGFCSPEDTVRFLAEAPRFEQMLVNDGIHLFKFWLDIGQEMQLKRFHARRHNPLKVWKLSPVDIKALKHWDDYTSARDQMLLSTHSDYAPWVVVRFNDKKRGRLALIQTVLGALDYEGKKFDKIGTPDPLIARSATAFLAEKHAMSE